MDPPVAKRPRGRPRKRRREEDNVKNDDAKKRVFESVPPKAYVGCYVLKEFKRNGIFLGKVVYYDTGLYRVEYEDGDREDLDSRELRGIVLDEGYFDSDLSNRRKKLDELVLKNSVKRDNELRKEGEKVELSTLTDQTVGGDDNMQGDEDVDSSSDYCDADLGTETENDTPLPPPPTLPLSSGTIGVPEECVPLLFSVYGFLRSFSIQLFLSPFALDDFVGSLNCLVPNTLLDAVHVALLRVLRKHLETLSSDGLEVASKCLRSAEWSLLDNMTWPVFLAQYLTVMGYLKGPEWNGFYDDLLDRDYYLIPVRRKLMILQILCDDVLESSEGRAEIDMREESEVGIDIDSNEANAPDDRPRRVHPRYSKTSACKDREAMDVITGSHEKNSRTKCTEGDIDDADENSDECRLCGMDGMLLCCDGCPSAYHSRCIGVMKMFLPEGPWYCPECSINKVGPLITKETSLAGAVMFGTDPYGQVFLGTCNHLVVFKAFNNAESCIRYYNQNDILRVLHSLHSSEQSSGFYSETCKAILKYWDVPKSILAPLEMGEMQKCIPNNEKFVDGFSSSLSFVGNNSNNILNANEAEQKPAVSENLDTPDTCPDKAILLPTVERSHEYLTSEMKLPKQIKMELASSTGLVSQQDSQLIVMHERLADKSNAMDSGDSNGSFSGQVRCTSLSVTISSQSKEVTVAGLQKGDKHSMDDFTYMGSSFKPHTYINNYMHGEFAASAAAKLAFFLSEEENKVSEPHGSSKKAASSILMQTKAFSLTASRFFWPTTEKKLVEVPRERCGWCHSCKAPVQSRRGCMLNNAALNAVRSAMKILPGLRPIKEGGGSLPSIATYILYMEECLHGLVAGPLSSGSYRKLWRSQVEKASSYKALKALLLELEGNIREIALSGDWVKLMDNWFVDTCVTQSAACTVGTTQTRGPGRKRQRKQSSSSEGTVDGDDRNFTWWHGGKLLKRIFQRATLPRVTVKRIARQGGSRRIAGISYADGSDVPRRSRQLVWRAAVDSCRNSSQLALQVRYLDLHVRWTDLIRPEQNFQDGKGQETDASVFRNAKVCDKTIVENNARYGVAFENQRHLPSRVMKNIIDIELTQDGKEKFWFSETHIPLYLIKEFEENKDEVHLSQFKNSVGNLSDLQKRQLKASRRDIFGYLVRKRDKLDKCSCASCQLDVLLGKAVKCTDCEGYCHEDCTMRSIFSSNEKVKISVICKKCYRAKPKSHGQSVNTTVYPSSPMPLHGKEHQNISAVKGTKLKSYNQPVASARTQESSSEKKAVASEPKSGSKGRSKLSWGIIWKKSNEDAGLDFRLKNILLKGNPDIHWLRPVCILCEKPYDPNLMYIRCGTCNNWYHAEAVELKESRVSDVKGFKCCKCRRIRSPICPYEDPDSKRRRKKAMNQDNIPTESDSGIISESKENGPNTPVFSAEEESMQDDPLLSLTSGELVTEQSAKVNFDWDVGSRPGPQKLPVRRHMKRYADNDSSSANEVSLRDSTVHVNTSGLLNSMEMTFPQAEWDSVNGLEAPRKLVNHGEVLDVSAGNEVSHAEYSVWDTITFDDPSERPSSQHAEWDASTNGVEGDVVVDYETFNYENMEFEPQTYFSYSELLASDDGGQFDGVDDLGDAENLESMPSATLSDGVPGQCEIGPLNTSGPAVVMGHCKMCSQTEPPPDLFCHSCGLLIHSDCSPWVESSCKDGWRCGNCQQQQ